MKAFGLLLLTTGAALCYLTILATPETMQVSDSNATPFIVLYGASLAAMFLGAIIPALDD